MTKVEWELFVKHFKAGYPRMKFLEDEAEKDVWFSYMVNVDFLIAKKVAKICFLTYQYPPKISEFMQQIDRMEERAKDKKSEIKKIYMLMEGYYPVSLRDAGRFKAFEDAIKDKDFKSVMKKAVKIKDSVIEVVMSVERGERESLPLLSECIKECISNV